MISVKVLTQRLEQSKSAPKKKKLYVLLLAVFL